jgi:hypothetical protein
LFWTTILYTLLEQTERWNFIHQVHHEEGILRCKWMIPLAHIPLPKAIATNKSPTNLQLGGRSEYSLEKEQSNESAVFTIETCEEDPKLQGKRNESTMKLCIKVLVMLPVVS